MVDYTKLELAIENEFGFQYEYNDIRNAIVSVFNVDMLTLLDPFWNRLLDRYNVYRNDWEAGGSDPHSPLVEKIELYGSLIHEDCYKLLTMREEV